MRIPWTSFARWLVPSIVAGCAGGLAAGMVEAAGYGPLEAIAIIGFAALVTIPALIAIGVIARGLAAAWPVTLDDGGGAPGLAGWIAVVWLGAVGLVWAMFQGTWLVSSWTQFKPLVVRIAEPAIAIVAMLVLVAISRPLSRVIAAAVRAIDVRWRRWRYAWLASAIAGVGVATLGVVLDDVVLGVLAGALIAWRAPRGSLVTPLRLAVETIVASVILAGVAWRWIVRPKLVGHFDFDVLIVPCVALAVTAAVHVVWPRLARVHARVAIGTSGVTMIAVVAATIVAFACNGVALRLWGDHSFAGHTIGWLFDPASLRERFSLDAPTALTTAHPDIVVITLDGVRADRAARTASMPALRGFADRGAAFDWAFSPSSGPRRSLAAIATGLAADRIDDPRRIEIAERFRAAGYTTAVFAPSGDVPTRGVDHVVRERSSEPLVAALAAWFATPADHPRFAWLDLADAREATPYDRALATSDALLAKALASLPAAIVVVTSAHGIGLGEHGQTSFGEGLYDSQTHVPLVIAGPGIAPGHVADTVSLVDLVPTLIELAGFEPPSQAGGDGRSLVALIAGAHLPGPFAGIAPLADDRWIGVVVGRYKIVQQGAHPIEVYNVRADPDEHANLRLVKGTPLEELRHQLDRLVDRETASPLN